MNQKRIRKETCWDDMGKRKDIYNTGELPGDINWYPDDNGRIPRTGWTDYYN